jgi:hypothetical protein
MEKILTNTTGYPGGIPPLPLASPIHESNEILNLAGKNGPLTARKDRQMIAGTVI